MNLPDRESPGGGLVTGAAPAGTRPASKGMGRAPTPHRAPGSGRRAPTWWDIPLAAALILGVALRLRQWEFGRSLWLDETAIGWNIRTRGFGGLLKPLTMSQAAPFGWLWLERIAVDLGGVGERVLRLVPLLFGIGLLLVLAWAARDLLAPLAAAAVVALASVSQYLVYYSNEIKQYSAEAFWCAALVALGIALVRRGLTGRRAVIFWGAALAAATMSMLAIPVAGVVGLVIALAAWRSAGGRLSGGWRLGGWRPLAPFLAAGAVWLAGALTIYLGTVRPAQGDPGLQVYWQKVYPTKPLTDVPATLSWLGDTVTALVTDPLDLRHRWALALLVVVGAVRCWRRYGPAVLAILLSPWAIGLGAAALGIYPMASRLALFAVPAALLLLGCAVEWPSGVGARLRAVRPARAIRLGGWAVTWCLLAVVVASTTITAYRQFGTPGESVKYRQTVQYVAARQQPGDVVLGTVLSRRALLWYGPGLHVSTAGLLRTAKPGEDCQPADLGAVLHGHSRAWLVEFTTWGEPENWQVRARLAEYGTIVAEQYLRGTRIVEYDLSKPPTGVAPGAGGSTCVKVLPGKMV